MAGILLTAFLYPLVVSFSCSERSQIGHMSKIASSASVSKAASAADVAGSDGGSITTEVEGSSSRRQVADVVIGPGGFVHDPQEEVRAAAGLVFHWILLCCCFVLGIAASI
jgi:hypothetical protein